MGARRGGGSGGGAFIPFPSEPWIAIGCEAVEGERRSFGVIPKGRAPKWSGKPPSRPDIEGRGPCSKSLAAFVYRGCVCIGTARAAMAKGGGYVAMAQL